MRRLSRASWQKHLRRKAIKVGFPLQTRSRIRRLRLSASSATSSNWSKTTKILWRWLPMVWWIYSSQIVVWIHRAWSAKSKTTSMQSRKYSQILRSLNKVEWALSSIGISLDGRVYLRYRAVWPIDKKMNHTSRLFLTGVSHFPTTCLEIISRPSKLQNESTRINPWDPRQYSTTYLNKISLRII